MFASLFAASLLSAAAFAQSVAYDSYTYAQTEAAYSGYAYSYAYNYNDAYSGYTESDSPSTYNYASDYSYKGYAYSYDSAYNYS